MKKYLDNIAKYLRETRAETKKVVWPEQRYVAVAALIIVITVFITGLYVLGIDFVFAKVFGVLLK